MIQTILGFRHYNRVEMSKPVKNLLSYFTSKNATPSTSTQEPLPTANTEQLLQEPLPTTNTEQPQDHSDGILIRDPGLRLQIWQHPVNIRDELRRRYIIAGPYQPKLQTFPRSTGQKQTRAFVDGWYQLHPWLEYSPSKDRAYCLYCFLFETEPATYPGFTKDGFSSWKRVGGKGCALGNHVGEKDPSSAHKRNVAKARDLMYSPQHISRALIVQDEDVNKKNRLRLRTSIESALFLALQGCAFRGHDESVESLNRGNFVEIIQHVAKKNEPINAVVLGNAPRNCTYTSPDIQKEILHILGDHVRRMIRKEVGDSKFCILVDEAQDVSNSEQMAIVLRYVDNKGFVKERFFGIVGISDTSASTLKREVSNVLVQYNLLVDDLRGQGYDGASNMRGAWKGLQALFKNECPYAYYVHCFAHQLQLALTAAAKDVKHVCLFFSMLNVIVTLITASPKRQSELTAAQLILNPYKVARSEAESGRGLNQIKTLQRACTTRWSSHLNSVSSLIDLFEPCLDILRDLSESGPTNVMRADAMGAHDAMQKFDFVFILHLVHEMMGITDMLCQALQKKNQDILNVIHLVASTKTLLLNLRDDKWLWFLGIVESFCEKYGIDILDMDALHMVGTRRSCQQFDRITMHHHYHVDIFIATIDCQLMELNHRFSETTMELLTLGSALDPRDSFKSFDVDKICKLAEKFYPVDIQIEGGVQDELRVLRRQLQHYEVDVLVQPRFQNLSTLSDLCVVLAETGLRSSYFLIDRLIRVLLTLPVSTASTERAFSAMKIVKTQLRNKMGDGFLEDCMIIHIEREFAREIDIEAVINEFDSLRDRRAALR